MPPLLLTGSAPVSGPMAPAPAPVPEKTEKALEKTGVAPRSGGEAVSFGGIALTPPKGWWLHARRTSPASNRRARGVFLPP
ncbi:hypothetical protein GCM10027187_08760 [Streptosporangium sandarakinum]